MVIAGEEAPRFSIEELEPTDAQKIIVSLNEAKRNPERAIDFKPYELPFLGDISIERLVKDETYTSFCLSHFAPSSKAPNGHRGLDHFISGQNMIAFDIDEGMTIEEAKDVLQNYTYLIYTTRSHQKEKNGVIVDRFRILMPTKTKFYVTPEQHKGMYENLSVILKIPTYDVATRNVSRLWFTNPEAEVFINEGDLIDVRGSLPDTENENKTIEAIDSIKEQDKRLHGFLRWFFTNTNTGSRNVNLYKLKMFCLDLGIDPEPTVEYANSKLAEPLPEREVQAMLRRR